MLTGVLRVARLPGQSVFWRFSASLHLSVAQQLVGKEHTIAPFGPVTGSEDFAYYLQHRPGCFLRLGNGADTATLHNAKYDFNDANLGIGAAFWTRLAEQFLAQGATPA